MECFAGGFADLAVSGLFAVAPMGSLAVALFGTCFAGVWLIVFVESAMEEEMAARRPDTGASKPAMTSSAIPGGNPLTGSSTPLGGSCGGLKPWGGPIADFVAYGSLVPLTTIPPLSSMSPESHFLPPAAKPAKPPKSKSTKSAKRPRPTVASVVDEFLRANPKLHLTAEATGSFGKDILIQSYYHSHTCDTCGSTYGGTSDGDEGDCDPDSGREAGEPREPQSVFILGYHPKMTQAEMVETAREELSEFRSDLLMGLGAPGDGMDGHEMHPGIHQRSLREQREWVGRVNQQAIRESGVACGGLETFGKVRVN